METQEAALSHLERMVDGWNDEKHLRAYQEGDRVDKVISFYRKRVGETLDLLHPAGFNEKLQWLKCYWRDERAYLCADKWEARAFITKQGYPELLIPLLGVWNSEDEIDFSVLPNTFVLKATNGSGWNLFVQNKESLDIDRVRRLFAKILKRHQYALNCEWVYERIIPRILCQPILPCSESGFPFDYKFFCFNGRARMVHVLTASQIEKNGEPTNLLITPEFETIPVTYGFPMPAVTPQKPPEFDTMLMLAQRLALDFPHVRVDLLLSDHRIYFGEYTFFTGSGCDTFTPKSYDITMGTELKLPPMRGFQF